MTARITTGLGLRAFKGGAVAVSLAVEDGAPRLLLSAVLATHAEEDRLSLEPYAVAAAMPRGPGGGASAAAAAVVADGRQRQDRIATAGLRDILGGLGGEAVVVALLVNRAGWVSDLLDYSLGWPEHVAVAEGLAVREALRAAIRACGVDAVELDEKSLPVLAVDRLGLPPNEIEARLKTLGATAGKPWRKEQKAACLAAWIAALGSDRG